MPTPPTATSTELCSAAYDIGAQVSFDGTPYQVGKRVLYIPEATDDAQLAQGVRMRQAVKDATQLHFKARNTPRKVQRYVVVQRPDRLVALTALVAP